MSQEGFKCNYCGQVILFGWNGEQVGECEHNPKPKPNENNHLQNEYENHKREQEASVQEVERNVGSEEGQ
jgi:hypothetical protein